MMEVTNNPQLDVILLAIIFDPAKRKILIARREKDEDIQNLTWQFPEGRLRYESDIDELIKTKVKEKTGYDVKNLGSIFSKIYPEKKDLLGIYFLCEVFSREEKPADDFVELKWVGPDELEKHFKTSFHPRLKEYLMNLK